VAGGDLVFNSETPGSASSTEGSAAADRYSYFNHFVVFVSNA